jgi:hypothetical protein
MTIAGPRAPMMGLAMLSRKNICFHCCRKDAVTARA